MATTKTLSERIADAKMKKEQLENQLKRLLQQEKEAARKARTHRLIELGALVESLLHEVDFLTNEDIKAVLTAALNSEAARETLVFVQKRQAAETSDLIPPPEEITKEEVPVREARLIRAQQSFREAGA